MPCVIQLQWSSWSSSAEGQGEFYTHTCVPTCTTGKVQLYTVDVTASQVSGGDYTRFSYYFPNTVPPGYSRSWTIDYDLGRWTGNVV